MDIRLFDNSKLSFEPTSRGLRIQLFVAETTRDGHGWSLRSGAVLSAEEIEELRATLTPAESDAGT